LDIETAPDHMAARVGYRKSRNGCHKCKTRHVKCNETTPLCHNCARLGLECTWPPHRHHQKQAQASSETHSVATSTSALPVGSGTASRGQLCVSSVPVDLDGPCDDIPESRLSSIALCRTTSSTWSAFPPSPQPQHGSPSSPRPFRLWP
jgi:Fungal Zn(2)-Cys(6) binuclear cluster domain